MILKQLLKPELMELIEEADWESIRTCLEDWDAPEVADLIMDTEHGKRVLIYRLLHRNIANDVFAYLDFDSQNLLLQDMADEETRHVLANLSADDRTTLFEELPSEVAHRLMGILPPDARKETLELLGYPEGSVGRLMTTEYVTVHPEWTVGESLEHFRKVGADSETMSVIFVVNEHDILLDEIRLRKFILSPPETKVRDLMEENIASLGSYQDQEEAVAAFKKYDMYCMPVLSSDGTLLGIVTADDVLDVAEEEATEDIHKGAAVNPLNESYRNISVWALVSRRIPWLVVLVFVGLISSGVLKAYEDTLDAMIALAFFIPMLMGSGGNTGSQAATLVVRALATNDLRPEQCWGTLMREVFVGLGMGFLMAVASGLMGWIVSGWWVGVVVSATMLLIVITTNLLGFFIPLILTKCKIDPAVASSPLITSIADSVCLVIYFTVASQLLHLAPLSVLE